MRWLKALLKLLVALIAILSAVYAFGPSPQTPDYNNTLPTVPADSIALAAFVQQEDALHKIKPGCEAEIVWANDSTRQKTEYAIVYLHGFSATKQEGDPVHRNLAKRYGCNLYLPRLVGHGIDTSEVFATLTAQQMWESAKQAYAVGKQLGKKVILLSTSTGGTMALQLCAQYPEIAANIMYSPNVKIFDPNAWVLNNNWGLQLAKMIVGGNYVQSSDQRDIFKKYWNAQYRLEGAVALQELIESSMKPATFVQVKQPTLLLYYYKDNVHQDSVVSVPAMQDMFQQLSTAANQKQAVAMPNTGDHVLASPIKSGDVAGVQSQTESFLEKLVGLKPM
jgi:esterase/lipase